MVLLPEKGNIQPAENVECFSSKSKNPYRLKGRQYVDSNFSLSGQ